MEKVMHG